MWQNNHTGNYFLEPANMENNDESVFSVKINSNTNVPIGPNKYVGNNISIKFEVDSGSTIIVISHQLYCKSFKIVFS